MGERANGHRVLAIDDEEKILSIVQDLLTGRGFQVTTCSESVKAIHLLKSASYDLVLLDIRMPGIEGTDLLPLIKKLHPSLPVIIVSAYCDDGHANYYRTLGAYDTVAKPFSHEILLEKIAQAIDQEENIPFVLRTLSLREGRDQVYRKLILAALRKTNWNQVKAAELLGVSRHCLLRWLKKLEISY